MNLLYRATSNETAGVTDFNGTLQSIFPGLTSQDLAEYNAAYPPSDFPSEMFRVRTATGEAVFRCGVGSFPNTF